MKQNNETKDCILQFSNTYYQLYHNYSTQISTLKVEQISNFFTSSLLSLKNVVVEDDKNVMLKRKTALYKTKRLVNEIVLLQYKADLDRKLLVNFLEASNELFEVLESDVS